MGSENAEEIPDVERRRQTKLSAIREELDYV